MANITTYLENKFLEHSLGKTTFDKPAATYAGLFITSPDVNYVSGSPTGTEVGSTDHGYARKLVTWTTATSGKITNSADITWLATGYWNVGTNATSSQVVGYIGILDSPNYQSGNLLWFGSLSAKIFISGSGDTFTIPSGSLALTLT